MMKREDEDSIRQKLTHIDDHLTETNKEALKFLCSKFTGTDPIKNNTVATDLFPILKRRYTDSESVCILYQLIGIVAHKDRSDDLMRGMKKLRQCFDTQDEDQWLKFVKENHMQFYQILLLASFKVDKKVFEYLKDTKKNKIKVSDLGTCTESIGPVLKLSERLLEKRYLDPSNPQTLITELSQPLKMRKLCTLACLDCIAVIRGNTQQGLGVGQLEIVDVVKDFSTSKCSYQYFWLYWKRFIGLLFFLLAVVCLITTLLPCISVELRDSIVEQESLETWNNVTFWALKKDLPSASHFEVKFELDERDGFYAYKFSTCMIHCDDANPPPYVTFHGNSTYSLLNCTDTDRRKIGCYVKFQEGDNIDTASPYVLAGTNFTIEIAPEDLDDNVTSLLYVFRSVSVCTNVSDKKLSADDLVSGAPFKFSAKNLSHKIELKNDSFVCAFFVSPQETFSYYIQREVKFYNFSFFLSNSLEEDCAKHDIDDPKDNPEEIVITLPSVWKQEVCIMANIELAYSKINIDIELVDLSLYEQCLETNLIVKVFGSLSAFFTIAFFVILILCFIEKCSHRSGTTEETIHLLSE